MIFQVTRTFGLGFIDFYGGRFEFFRLFYYDRLIGILLIFFLADILN